MENNKKGMNVLYPVLGVATLVVAIIGATFAYFSASQTADNIQGNIANAGGIELSVDSITDYYDATKAELASRGSNLIPLNLMKNSAEEAKELADENYTWESQFGDAVANKCVDDLGNNICEIYRITVTNKGNVPIQIRGNLTLEALGVGYQVPENLYWRLINVTEGTGSYTVEEEGEEGPVTNTINYPTVGTASEIDWFVPVKQGSSLPATYITKGNTAGAEEEPVYGGVNVDLAAGATQKYYVIVWLEEIGEAQESVDASGIVPEGSEEAILRGYKGIVTFDAVNTDGVASGVTATFNKS